MVFNFSFIVKANKQTENAKTRWKPDKKCVHNDSEDTAIVKKKYLILSDFKKL